MAKVRDVWVRVALILALLLPVYFLVAALGAKFGLLDWRIALGVMVLRLGVLVVPAVLVIAAVGLILALAVKPRRGWRSALAALVIPTLILGFAITVAAGAKSVPPIHDISTDINDPPQFSARILAVRAAVPGGNAVEPMNAPMASLAQYRAIPALADKTVGGLGQAANPDLKTVILHQPPGPALDLAARVAAAQGWKVSPPDRAAGTIEAVAESLWFGFKDDIVIRVRPGPETGESQLDVRSASRVGLSDLGANAKRVRAYLVAVRAAE